MARDKEYDSASSTSGQSKRPPLSRQESDLNGEAHQRPKGHQKQHHVGRIHARVPSSKALQKYGHGHGHGAHGHGHAHASTTKLNNNTRRTFSPPDSPQQPQRPSSHRRATSDGKLTRDSSATSIQKSVSQTSLKRNRSHGEVHKRTRSSEKIRRNSLGLTAVNRPKSSKSQVHFDLGGDGQDDDEWVDASGSNSPHLSRKGSINSSAQSSLKPNLSAGNSRPQTPNEQAQRVLSSPDRERLHQKEYLTTRILQRTPSHGAPPQMTNEMAQVNPQQFSPSSGQEATLAGSSRDGLTSRFVDTPASGITSEGSFYRPERSGTHHSDDLLRRPASMAELPRAESQIERARVAHDTDDSALVPKPARRTAAKSAETSRIQQKLNLQRASSAIEPNHGVATGPGNLGASPLIGVGGPVYDAGNSRDPRMTKLMDRTGSEYLVVRRYQNPVARSLNRLTHLPDINRTKRIPRVNTGSSANKRSLEMPLRHTRNVSLPDQRRQASRSNLTLRTNGGSNYDDNEDQRLNERLSGSSLVGNEEDNGTLTLLRNLWEKSIELSASGD
ncbi:hypothetical protein V2G26_008814 [Clonostachys chloroleuca]